MGVCDVMEKGLFGFLVVDVVVILIDGLFYLVDSFELVFCIVGCMVMFEVLVSVVFFLFELICKVMVDMLVGSGLKVSLVLLSCWGQIFGLVLYFDWLCWEWVEVLLFELGFYGFDVELCLMSQGFGSYCVGFDYLVEFGGKYVDEVVKVCVV